MFHSQRSSQKSSLQKNNKTMNDKSISKSVKSALLNWRNYIIIPLCTVGFFGLFSEPTSDSNFVWTMQFIISKSIGFGACYAVYKLVTYWEKRGELHFDELDDEDFFE